MARGTKLNFVSFDFFAFHKMRKQIFRTVELPTGLKTLHFISGLHTKFFFYNKMSGSTKLFSATNKIFAPFIFQSDISLWWLFQNWLLWLFSKQWINVLPQSLFSLLDNPMELNDSEMENFAQLFKQGTWRINTITIKLGHHSTGQEKQTC